MCEFEYYADGRVKSMDGYGRKEWEAREADNGCDRDEEEEEEEDEDE